MIEITSKDIELAIINYFNIRQNMIIPNVSWGFFNNNEVDLLMISSAGFLTEIEIKISKSDFKKDMEKTWHQKPNNLIKKLYFAMPAKIAKNIEYLPKHAGLLIYHNESNRYKNITEIVKPEISKTAKSISDNERMTLYRLGCFKIWKHAREAQDWKNMYYGLKKINE